MAEFCIECGDKIIGRVDKKFCNDSCRNAYNNRQNRDSTNIMRSVHHKLRTNFRILDKLHFNSGKSKVSRQILEKEGFDFEYFTNLKVYKNGAEYRFLYNIGYKYIDNDMVLVVKNDQEEGGEEKSKSSKD